MIYKFKEFKDEPLLINHLNMGGKNPKGEEINVKQIFHTKRKTLDRRYGRVPFFEIQQRELAQRTCKNESRRYNYCFNVSVLDIPRRN